MKIKLLLSPEDEIHSKPEKLHFQFDKPPGRSPSRWRAPFFDKESFSSELRNSLANRVRTVEIQGVVSGALTGESYTIVLFILAGITGGILGAIGQDIWKAVIQVLKKVLKRNGSRNNYVEVALELEEVDIIFHIEGQLIDSLPAMLADGDLVLDQLQEAIKKNPSFLDETETIELRRLPNGTGYRCVRHSYRKTKFILQETTNDSKRDDTPNPHMTKEKDNT